MELSVNTSVFAVSFFFQNDQFVPKRFEGINPSGLLQTLSCDVAESNRRAYPRVVFLLKEEKMKFYTKKFLQSKRFYDRFYLPDISLEHYVIWENRLEKMGTHEEAIEIVNNNYITHCKYFFNENIHFYNQLSQYLKDTNGEFRRLDEYTFFKLRYYGTNFLDIVNENRNFLKKS